MLQVLLRQLIYQRRDESSISLFINWNFGGLSVDLIVDIISLFSTFAELKPFFSCCSRFIFFHKFIIVRGQLSVILIVGLSAEFLKTIIFLVFIDS